MAAALDHTYHYLAPSEVSATPAGPALRLATSGGAAPHPYFFDGRLRAPRRTGDLLLALHQIVQSRFYIPPAMLHRMLREADPVVTSGGERLRFEVFSSCCSVYGRVDLLPDAIDGEVTGHGTTNVDFNPPMRAAIARLRDRDRVGLRVGSDSVAIERNEETTVERKVKLPVRWLKGFVEAQAYLARLERRPRLQLSGPEAFRFLRGLPAGSHGRFESWVVRSGSGARLSQRRTDDAVPVSGIERLRILEPIARHARELRVYASEGDGVSSWELATDDARFHLALSPDVSRGFSGEGQVLTELVDEGARARSKEVRALLGWQAVIAEGDLGRRIGADTRTVRRSLAVLGTRGLVGFDVAEGAYFHRELPFDLGRVEDLQPRLLGARELVEAGQVRVVREDGQVEAYVQGTDVEHRVLVEGDEGRCTCRWHARHQGRRGPCKHVLAVLLWREG
jgi:hypothetical protein